MATKPDYDLSQKSSTAQTSNNRFVLPSLWRYLKQPETFAQFLMAFTVWGMTLLGLFAANIPAQTVAYAVVGFSILSIVSVILFVFLITQRLDELRLQQRREAFEALVKKEVELLDKVNRDIDFMLVSEES